MNQLKSAFKQTNIQLLAIVLVTFLVYINSLFNGLVWDDHLFLESWPQIQSTKGIGEILRGSAPPAQDKVYRPLRGVFYVIDWQIFKANPFGYHLQALLIHLGITVLVYFIAAALVGTKGQRDKVQKGYTGTNSKVTLYPLSTLSLSYSVPNLLPFIVALLFGIHPIHTETIDYISASMETWGTLFFFLAFYLYIKSDSIRDEGLMWLSRVGSVLMAIAAFFTYEMTLTLPLLIVLADLTFFGTKEQRDKVYKGHKVTESKVPLYPLSTLSLSHSVPKYLPYFAAAAFYAFIRFFVLHISSRTDYLAYSFYHTMLVMFKVFLRYILLLFVPIQQTSIHNLVGDFPASMTPYDKLDPILSQTIFDFDVLAAVVILVGLILVAVRLTRRLPVISFAILWFFIALFPVSYIIPPGGAMAEKYLYIASFGVIFGAAWGVFMLFDSKGTLGQRDKVQKGDKGTNSNVPIYPQSTLSLSHYVSTQAVIYLGIIVVLFYGVSTIARNAVWKNDITLFSDVVKKSPNNLLANYTLGIWFGNTGQLDASVTRYKKALSIAPEFWEARYNLANIYLKTANYDLAADGYKEVLKVNTKFRAAQNLLDNMDIVKKQQEATTSAVLGDELFANYKKIKGLSFSFPLYWEISQEKDKQSFSANKVVLLDSASDFTVEIFTPIRYFDKNVDDYPKKQKETFGTLANEGPAQIPNVDSAWVRVWSYELGTEGQGDKVLKDIEATKLAQISNNQRQSVRLQFFLFKGNQVVQVFAYPASGQMQTFDLILGSIRIE